MSGSRKTIYDDVRSYLQTQRANLNYVDSDHADQLLALLHDPACYRGQKIQAAKAQLDELTRRVSAQVEKERANVFAQIAERWQRLLTKKEFVALSGEQQAQLAHPFEQLREDVARQPVIAVIKDMLHIFDTGAYISILDKLAEWTRPTQGTETGSTEPGKLAERKPEYVNRNQLVVDFDKLWIENQDDIEAYLQALRKALQQALASGKQITI